MAIDIVEWAGSQYGFYVDRHYEAGRWVLQPGPIQLADYHARILRHIFTPDEAGRWPYDVIGWCEPAKSGKSAIAGLVAEYVALHGEQNSTIILASNKIDQAASLMFKSLTDSIEFNPHLRSEPGKYEVTFRNGNTVRAIPSNSKGEAGARFSLALFDELWAYVYQDATRLWTEFKTDPTRLNSLKFAIGYGGYVGEGELWQSLLETGIKGEPIEELADIVNEDGSPTCYANGRQFTFWSHTPRQPWQTTEWIEGQRKSLRPAEYLRMIETIFAEGVGDFCEPEAWEALITSDHTPLLPGDKRPLYLGLDVATSPKGDDCALAGVYAESNLVKLGLHKVWKGKERTSRLKLKSTVYPYILKVKEDYNLQGVWFDPFQALSLAEDLRSAGVRCIEVPQTHSTRGPKDTALLDMVNGRQLMLYPHADLTNLASKAHAKELGNGLIFLKKASGRSKIDLLIALSNVANEPIYNQPGPAEFHEFNPFYGSGGDYRFEVGNDIDLKDILEHERKVAQERRAEADQKQALFLKKYYPQKYVEYQLAKEN